ncbi:MAG: hypothetical protein GC159_08870 [Phycisphaera sp.]|nr:hypothetical protein [Phycisphaera sp.]
MPHIIATLITLAQVDTEEAKAQAKQWYYWFTNDPLGQKLTLLIAILIGLLILFMILKRIKVAAHTKSLMIVAGVIGGMIWASSFFDLQAGGWATVGIIGVLMFTAFFFLFTKLTSGE